MSVSIRILMQLAAVFAFAFPAMAEPILDQSQLMADQTVAIHSTISSPVARVGQTFTVGIDGLLDSIELSLSETGSGGDLVVNILDMSGGDLSLAPSLGGVSIAEMDLGPFVLSLSATSVTATLIDLSSLGIDVNVVDVLAVDLSTSRALPNLYGVRRQISSDEYAGGAHFAGNSFISSGADDLAFKTFVTPVPIPPAVWLFGSGLLGLVGMARRKKTV